MDAKEFEKLIGHKIDLAVAQFGIKWQIENFSPAELDLKIDNPKGVARKDIEQAIINVLVTLPKAQLPQNLHFHYD